MEPKFELLYREISPGATMEVADLTIDSVEARHTRETNPIAVRIQAGEVRIAYTGDGELTDELSQLVNGVDLLVAESYFYDKAVPWHLNYPDIEKLDAKRIVLTHMSRNMLEQVDRVPEECARDGYTISI